MKRFVFLMAAVFVAFTSMAVDISHLHKKGLPTKAVPAKLYFENMFANTPSPATTQDISESALSGFDNEYFFFVEQFPSAADDLYALINLWMYDSEKDEVSKIFSQQGEEYEELEVLGISWLLDKQSSFKDVVVSDSKQKISVQKFTSKPVVILQSEIFTGFAHSPQMTLLVYPDTKKVLKLENQMFVCVSHTLANMLMMAEMDYAQDYIITTSTGMRSEEQPLKETDEYTIFHKQYLYPELHVYSARGKKVGSLSLPEDEVDMIR